MLRQRWVTWSALRSLLASLLLLTVAGCHVLFYANLLDGENYEKGGWAPQTPTAPQRPWRSSHSAVLAMATNLNQNDYEIFVGSLRATGYDGHIILGIRPDTSSEIIEYLEMQNVTMHRFYKADKCTYDGYLNNEGKPLDMNNPPSGHPWQCPKEYPDYKITHARFALYKDWLVGCEGCTDGIMLTDARDSFFQAGKSFISMMMCVCACVCGEERDAGVKMKLSLSLSLSLSSIYFSNAQHILPPHIRRILLLLYRSFPNRCENEIAASHPIVRGDRGLSEWTDVQRPVG
jgi:hypothetical protein